MMVYLSVYMIKAMFVVFVGIGIKICQYDPIPEQDFFMEDLRFLLSLSLFVVFILRPVIKCIHESPSGYLAPFFSLASPTFIVASICHTCITVAMLVVYLADLQPWELMLLQACLCIASACSTFVEDYARYHYLHHGHHRHGHHGHDHGKAGPGGGTEVASVTVTTTSETAAEA